MTQDYIEIRGARENNLKNVSYIPRHKITIFTGVSGSGKSSIVFDTIATEAQRQLYETFSMFVRNFLPRYAQPDADLSRTWAWPSWWTRNAWAAARIPPWAPLRISIPCCGCCSRGSESLSSAIPTSFRSTIRRACARMQRASAQAATHR